MSSELTALVIEDEETWQYLHSRMLKEADIKKIDIAESQERAIQYIRENKYHIILSDTMDDKYSHNNENHNPMGPNSIQVVRDLNKNSLIIACSNSSSYEKKWEPVGFDHFLTKGLYSCSDLIKIVESVKP